MPLTEHRDALIAGPLREAVARLLEEAQPCATKLQGFGPDFGRNISDRGTGTEVELWQASRPLAQKLAALHRAWLVSWGIVTRHGGEVSMDLRPQRPGGYFAWVAPDAVTDERLRLGHDTEPLRIALAASEYRLLAPSELQSVIEGLDDEIRDMESRPPYNGSQLVRRGVC